MIGVSQSINPFFKPSSLCQPPQSFATMIKVLHSSAWMTVQQLCGVCVNHDFPARIAAKKTS